MRLKTTGRVEGLGCVDVKMHEIVQALKACCRSQMQFKEPYRSEKEDVEESAMWFCLQQQGRFSLHVPSIQAAANHNGAMPGVRGNI